MSNKTQEKPKRTFRSIFFAIVLGFLIVVFAIISCTQLISSTNEKEIASTASSWEEWVKNRDYIKSFSKHVLLKKDAYSIYNISNDYWNDHFYKNCKIDACSEYKGFIRAARDASKDGFLSPEDLVDIAKSQVLLDLTISNKDKEIKARFKK